MAQKKKGGFFQRIIMGSEKAEGYARSTLPSNRWELGWDIFKGRFWKLVLVNLMLLVGALGIIFCVVMMYMGNVVIGSSLPFGQNLGMGYPYVEGLEAQAVLYQIGLTNTYFLLLIPACLLFGVVCSGVFYIMRNLVWTEGVFIANDFWRGLKQNIVQILFVMLGYSVFLLISKFSLNQIAWLEFNGQGNFFFSFSCKTVPKYRPLNRPVKPSVLAMVSRATRSPMSCAIIMTFVSAPSASHSMGITCMTL